MDFSSVPRVLDSLLRRQPPLDEAIVNRVEVVRKGGESSGTNLWVTAVQEWLTVGDVDGKVARWEPLAVGIYLATELLKQHAAAPENVYLEGPRLPSVQPGSGSSSGEADFVLPTLSSEEAWSVCKTLHASAMSHLEHAEPRVRTLVAKAVTAYAAMAMNGHEEQAAAQRRELHERLLKSIHEHIEAGRDENGEYSRSSTGALDDTTGWRALETNWQCLAALVSALQSQYFTEFPVSEEWLQDCQFSCVTHVNRHVRAAAMAVLEQCVMATDGAPSEEKEALLQTPTSPLRQTLIAVLRTGLADNWSQVRMAASVLCRVFLTRLPNYNLQTDKALLAALLPRMCLNRFYLAQGVKLYSHETWKLVFPDSGLPVVAQNLPAVVRYYVKMVSRFLLASSHYMLPFSYPTLVLLGNEWQCDADNHVVREAACQAIAELAVRFGLSDDEKHAQEYHELLQEQIDVLLQALLMCFHDESWPVRDEACLACGTLCKSYPEECRSEFKTLWERWTEQLTDQIWSVRQDAAVALGDALDAYGLDVWGLLSKELIPKILPAARDQPPMTREEYKAHMNDTQAHTDTQLYSCGSLAPKLKKKAGAGRIGCTNCGIDRPKAPWEATDGCIYLLRELALRIDQFEFLNDGVLLPLLTELADVCRVQHFPQADELRATLWKQLPVIAQALGKQRFKRQYLDIFLDLLFWQLDSRSASPLSLHAAGQCAEALSEVVGKGIFRGRLDMNQQDTFDRVMRERQLEQASMGPIARDTFSPFGPPGLLDGIGGGAASGGAGFAGRYP